MVPDPLEFPQGCKFHPRCPFAMEKCKTEDPALLDVNPDKAEAEPHFSACWHMEENPDTDLWKETEIHLAGTANGEEGAQ